MPLNEISYVGNRAIKQQYSVTNVANEGERIKANRMVNKKQTPLSQAREQVANTSTFNLWFSRFATRTAQFVAHPYMFLFAVLALLLWAASGPIFRFSDTWQLVINTGTTIITFLVVFLIQNTQNRDAKALHLKLDELIRSHQPAATT